MSANNFTFTKVKNKECKQVAFLFTTIGTGTLVNHACTCRSET